MKLISFKNLESRILVVMLTIALVLTGTVFGWFIWRTEQSKNIATLKQEILTNPEKTGESILYLKEILIMSARTSVTTRDLKWEKQYKEFEPRLTEKIEEIKTVLPDVVELQSTEELEKSGLELLSTEKRAFTLMRDERFDEAHQILFSPQYEAQKTKFFAEIPNVVVQLNELQKNELDSEYSYSNRFIGIAIAVFGLSLIAWISAIRNISVSHRKLIVSTAEKERTQEALRKSEQYQNLFRLANDAILVIEPETEIVLDANDKACEIYGYKREDFIGLNLQDISENSEKNRLYLEELKKTGRCREFENVQFRADGSPFNLMISSSIIEYHGKDAILSINRDITERKKADAALRESEYKMRTLLDSMSEGLVQLIKTRSSNSSTTVSAK